MIFYHYTELKSKDRILQVVATCTFALQHSIELMDQNGLLLSDGDAEAICYHLHLHLKTYSWLASYFWGERKLYFRMRPKHHCLYHQALQAKAWAVNPCVFHTWDEESFLGKIKNICQQCHGKTATARLFQRYLLCMAMMLEQHRRLVPSKW